MKIAAMSFLLVLGLANFSATADADVISQAIVSPETVVWPDYKKDFKQTPSQFFPVIVQNDPGEWKNKYVLGVRVVVGLSSAHLDNLEDPRAGVVEYSILGNESVMRVLMARGDSESEWVIVDLQLLVNNQWKRGCPPIMFYLTDPEKLLKNGKMAGILLVAESVSDGSLIQLKLENKLEK